MVNDRLQRILRVGTRTSRLAYWQTGHIVDGLGWVAPEVVCEAVPFVTEGDRLLNRPLPEIGGKGVFTEALEAALRSGEIDFAVHSLKDLPVEEPPDIRIVAICCRADPRDVLIAPAGVTIRNLPRAARIGTCSTRRAAQLRRLRPDCRQLPIRGNVDTRVRKVATGEYDAIVLAAAGIFRLGLEAAIASHLELDEMLPAPGQGALAVQCRADDQATLDILARLDEPEVRAAVTAEREFLDALGGGCDAPVAAHATMLPGTRGELRLVGRVIAPDGGRVVQVEGSSAPEEARALGRRLGDAAIASGGKGLLS